MAGPDLLSLEYTPTYAVATVVTIIVAASIALERSLSYLRKWLHDSGQKPLSDAVEKVQEELMLLGFISLLLTIFQNNISNLCVPSFENSYMLPCKYPNVGKASTSETLSHSSPSPSPSLSLSLSSPPSESHHRRLLRLSSPLISSSPNFFFRPSGSSGTSEMFRRILSEESSNTCEAGKQPFVSVTGIHQLHIFIFLLAMVHIGYSGATMLLAIYKIHRWKSWEEAAIILMDKCQKLTPTEKMKLMQRKSTFVRRHTSTSLSIPLESRKNVWWKNFWGRRSVGEGEGEGDKDIDFTSVEKEEETTMSRFLWIVCFFRQFGQSLSKSDYLTLRMAFITNHNISLKFDFHQYLVKSMEDDFKHVVGTSWSLWIWVVIILLLNVHGWNILFWVDIIPIILALLVGTKLQHVIATLAFEGRKVDGVCVGRHVKARDALFWFHNPQILIYILHFIIFQNSFELSIYFWYLWEFGTSSCLFGIDGFNYTRLALSIAVQFLCSYITLPLYCLVTQMGSSFKRSIFEEHLHLKLTAWAKRHKKKKILHLSPADVADKIQATIALPSKAVKQQTDKKNSTVKSKGLGQIVEEERGERNGVDEFGRNGSDYGNGVRDAMFDGGSVSGDYVNRRVDREEGSERSNRRSEKGGRRGSENGDITFDDDNGSSSDE